MKRTQLKALPPEPSKINPDATDAKTMLQLIERDSYVKQKLTPPHFPAAKPQPVSHGQMGEILRGLTKKRKVTTASATPAWDKVLGWMKGGVR